MIEADITPLNVSGTSGGWSHVVTTRGERRLVLGAPRGTWIGFVMVTLIGGVFWSVPRIDANFGAPGNKMDPWEVFGVRAFGGLLMGIGVLCPLLAGPFVFDREARVVRKKWFFVVTKWWRALDDVRAVQVILGEPSTTEESGTTKLRPTYQLNLVLADPNRPRINLTSRFEWAGTLTTAQQVAEFLGVPLLDATAPAPAKVRSVGTIRMAELIAELASETGVEPRVARRALGAFLAHLRKWAEPDEFDRLMAALPEGRAVLDDYQSEPGSAPIGFAKRLLVVMTGTADRDAASRVGLMTRLARAGLSDPQIDAFHDATLARLRDVLPLNYVPPPKADPSTG